MANRKSLILLLGVLAILIIIGYQMNSKSPDYPASNLHTDDYEPDKEWKLVWADEFEGDTLNPDNWNRQVVKAGRFNKEWQAYTDSVDNAYVEEGCLVIKAIHHGDWHGRDQYSSARLNTAGKQAWKYGKVAARIQLPHGKGMWPAFWMLGTNCDENGGDTPWPFCGEIDIMEMYGSKNDAVVEANIHFADMEDKHEMLEAIPFELEKGIFADRFHVFEVEWDQEAITWKMDGETYATVDISTEDKREFHQEYFILLNIAVGGAWAGRPDATTPFPQFMYVDWVRVYQKD
ncbi:glycoside hydrolase family 16 protein [Puniceicoccales bacterium CK1056]|uniref:Glycoside hydrolase family 16 protein n=1 Tax=Oceanipulchritudo coccoides TaxID=2706888 RepID=A0A6B2M658_9BACT|nr:glycoside hydrolase family 16 protein [Oceanipulchritudo coccoides]NDV63594.1 glycoside hydrolase family 16 protein [Oceanipulchritudo coccoides]